MGPCSGSPPELKPGWRINVPPNPSVFNAVKPSRAMAVDVTAVGADQEKTYQKHVLHEAERPAPLELELIQHHSVCRSKCTAARGSRNEAAENKT